MKFLFVPKELKNMRGVGRCVIFRICGGGSQFLPNCQQVKEKLKASSSLECLQICNKTYILVSRGSITGSHVELLKAQLILLLPGTINAPGPPLDTTNIPLGPFTTFQLSPYHLPIFDHKLVQFFLLYVFPSIFFSLPSAFFSFVYFRLPTIL